MIEIEDLSPSEAAVLMQRDKLVKLWEHSEENYQRGLMETQRLRSDLRNSQFEAKKQKGRADVAEAELKEGQENRQRLQEEFTKLLDEKKDFTEKIEDARAKNLLYGVFCDRVAKQIQHFGMVNLVSFTNGRSYVESLGREGEVFAPDSVSGGSAKDLRLHRTAALLDLAESLGIKLLDPNKKQTRKKK